MHPSDSALLLIDLINPFDYPDAANLLRETDRIVEPVLRLQDRFRRAGRPVIYVNDNFSRWQSNFPTLVKSCSEGPGAALIEAFHPEEDHYFVLKPQRSGFYLTPLGLLLQDLRVGRLILCGIATDMCVLATANDACMRNFSTTVVSDGTASFDETRHWRALEVITVSLQATVCRANDI